jgi:hypothetical protein
MEQLDKLASGYPAQQAGGCPVQSVKLCPNQSLLYLSAADKAKKAENTIWNDIPG